MGLKAFRDKLIAFAGPRLAWAYINFSGATSRLLQDKHPEVAALEAAGKNYVLAFWHARQAILVYTHRDVPCATLVSRSKDGEIIAETLRLCGQRTVRGSSSRGGVAAMKELIDVARETGLHPAFTPDGPRGPERKVQPGVLFLAREMGLPIVPLASGLRNKKIFRTWEDFEFPFPFNTIAEVHGKPIYVGADDDLEKKAEELRVALDETTAKADAMVRD